MLVQGRGANMTVKAFFLSMFAWSLALTAPVPGNLLANSDLSQGKDKSVAGWTFSTANLTRLSAEEAAKVNWGLRGGPEGQSLFIGLAANHGILHVWWSQNVRVTPGTTYVYSFQGKGSAFIKSKHAKWFGINPAIILNGPGNKFIRAIGGFGVTNGDWTLYSATFFVPEGVESVDLRLAINSLGVHEPIEADFKDLELLPQSAVIPE